MSSLTGNDTNQNQPSKTTGQFNSVKGTVVETIGNLTGAESWTKSGQEQHADGEEQYKKAQAKGYAQGVTDHVVGKKDAVVGAVTGDTTQQGEGNVRQQKGEAQQDLNKPT